jgi:hypothetical protein
MARNDFRLAAERGEAAAYSADGWLAMGQRGRAAAIYLELRQIDARTAEKLAREIETARRHVRGVMGTPGAVSIALTGIAALAALIRRHTGMALAAALTLVAVVGLVGLVWVVFALVALALVTGGVKR